MDRVREKRMREICREVVRIETHRHIDRQRDR